MNSLTEPKSQVAATPMVYYQCFLAIAAILVFFTKLDIYLQNRGFILPLHWMIGFLFVSFPLFLSLVYRLDSLSKPVIIASLAYITLSLISIIIQPQLPKLQYLEDQYRTIIFLWLMLAIFAYHPLVAKCTKLTALGVTLLNVVLFIYEFLNPMAFYVEQIAPGRSSGFYADSNTAGTSLIIGMILTLDLIKPKYRLFYALFVFIGVASTFSRGAIVCWFIAVGFLLLRSAIPRYQLPLLGIFLVTLIIILSTQLRNLAYLQNAQGDKLLRDDTLARIEFILDPTAQRDDSKASRITHLEDAWQKFANRPFVGNGLGAGENNATVSQTGIAQRSHNTYLDFMVEFGFLGAFVFPAVLFASIYHAAGKFRQQAIAFLLLFMTNGLFSHTLMSEFCSLVSYAMMTNLARHSSESASEPVFKPDNFLYQNSEI